MRTERRERLPVGVSAAVYIEDEQGRLLLLQQASMAKAHKWGPPAGGMHAHEDPIMTAEREAREEIGVEVELIDIVGIYTVDRGNNASGMAYVFRGRISKGRIKVAEGEIMNYRYFTPDEIGKMIEDDIIYKPEYNIRGVEDWLNGSSNPLDVIKPFVE